MRSTLSSDWCDDTPQVVSALQHNFLHNACRFLKSFAFSPCRPTLIWHTQLRPHSWKPRNPTRNCLPIDCYRGLHPEEKGKAGQGRTQQHNTNRQRNATATRIQQAAAAATATRNATATQRTARVHVPWPSPRPRTTLNEAGLVLLKVLVSSLAHVVVCRWSTVCECCVWCVVCGVLCGVCVCVFCVVY